MNFIYYNFVKSGLNQTYVYTNQRNNTLAHLMHRVF